jgi:hypothetical protein
MSRYDVDDFENYTHLLALYRNTRAIEAMKARIRYMELEGAAASVEKARLSLIRSLQDRHTTQ